MAGGNALSHSTFVAIKGKAESHREHALVFSEKNVAPSARQSECPPQTVETQEKVSQPVATLAIVPTKAPLSNSCFLGLLRGYLSYRTSRALKSLS